MIQSSFLSQSQIRKIGQLNRLKYQSMYYMFHSYCETMLQGTSVYAIDDYFASHCIETFFKQLDIEIQYNQQMLEQIPATGPFAVIANQPLGGLDALLLYKIISQKRPDFKIVEDIGAIQNPVFEKIFFQTYPFADSKGSPNKSGIIKMYEHFKNNQALGFFPAQQGNIYKFNKQHKTDGEWQTNILGAIKYAEIPIIPVYIQHSDATMLEIAKKTYPVLSLKRLRLPFFKKNNYTLQCIIGAAISSNEQKKFNKDFSLTRYVRAHVYVLAYKNIEIKDFFSIFKQTNQTDPKPIIEPVPVVMLEQEINSIRKNDRLFSFKQFEVYCSSAVRIPFIIREIGRLRELTFRAVGEGTNNEIDIDEYDIYYEHLFIWDTTAKKVVGAYRIGKGNEILKQYGKKGFYIHSLFKIQNTVLPILSQSLELGRSFIVPEYQKHHHSLFLLWRGIVYFLLKNEEYRYLIGPVSISNSFTEISKSLIVSFIKSQHFHHTLAKQIRPRKDFKVPKKLVGDIQALVEHVDLKKLDSFISNYEEDLRIPVLLKKYISLNAKIINFNIDPLFNNCLDGLIIVDIFEIPFDNITAIAKDVDDTKILQRFFN